MRRALITGFASLLALALIAPAAQAATKTRHFQDRAVTVDSHGGEIGLTTTYKNKKAKGQFTLRSITLYDIEILPVSCNPGGDQFLTAFGPTNSIKVTKGKYNHDFADEGAEGGLSGKAIKTDKRLEGKINFIDADPGAGTLNCTTDGPRSYSATPCRTTNQNLDVPVCRVGGGS